jgi:hypothetical protein
MSAAMNDAVARTSPRGSGAPVAKTSLRIKVLELGVAGLAFFLVAIGIVLTWSTLVDQALEMIPWLLLVTAAELLPISYGPDVNLTLSMPLLLAAGMTLGPVPAGLLGFAGSWDGRLLRHEISWGRAMFNRGQIALSSMAAAWVFQGLDGDVGACRA